MTTYGFSILIFYFFIKKELHMELHDLWKNDKLENQLKFMEKKMDAQMERVDLCI